MKMNYKERVINNLQIIFSKKGYNITFNKKHPEYKDGVAFNENQSGHNNTMVLTAEYVTISLFILLSIVLYFYLGVNSLVYSLLLSIVPLFLVLILNTGKFHEISRKYGDDKGTSGLLFLSLLFVPSIIMGGIFLGLIEDNWWVGLRIILITAYPWLLMLCRINVFSDKSIPRYEGPKMSIELGPGYVPLVYWLLSFQIGLNVTGYGITGIGSYIVSGHPSMLFCMFSLILGLISQTIVVSPDIIDKIVPVDMRMKKGYVLMVILTIVLVFVSWAIMEIIP
jgi:hypothetical protein